MSSLIIKMSLLVNKYFFIGLFTQLKEWTSSKLGWNLLATPKSERQKVKDDYFAENQKLGELERKQAELDGKLGNDYGPDNVFLTLVDRSAAFSPPQFILLLPEEMTQISILCW